LTELAEQARTVERQLGEMLAQVEEQYGEVKPEEESLEEAEVEEPEPEKRMPRRSPAARKRIEELYDAAAKDRSKAFELKQELDRLGLFKEYEDRFLDLFKKAE
jgi:hypothetical protein